MDREIIVDERALRILFDTYWSAQGWKRDEQCFVSPDDFAYAKSKGVMFDPVKQDHNDILNQLTKAIKLLDRRLVADAFLASLSTRRLDWRSALGSYAVYQHIAAHPPEIESNYCVWCGFFLPEGNADLNILNFERLKWGGVRHTCIDYAAMDLDIFLRGPAPSPTKEDVKIFRNLLDAIETAPPGISSAALHSHFAKVIKSNKAEREVIIGILGFCDILSAPGHPGFSDAFLPTNHRDLPDRRFVDMQYPACWWRSEDGINREKLSAYFGHIL